jgi:hypothetical protein
MSLLTVAGCTQQPATPVGGPGNASQSSSVEPSDPPRSPPGNTAVIDLRPESRSDERQWVFEVRGIDPASLSKFSEHATQGKWPELFKVQVVGQAADGEELPPLAGSYIAADDRIIFKPQFPIERGSRYRAQFFPDRLAMGQAGSSATPAGPDEADPTVADFMLPKPPIEATTTVSHVFPSKDELPENQLKFYIHFSAPMSRGEAYDSVRLLNEDGVNGQTRPELR